MIKRILGYAWDFLKIFLLFWWWLAYIAWILILVGFQHLQGIREKPKEQKARA